MRRSFLALALLALGGCEQTIVLVDCVATAAPAAECEVRHAQGTGEVEACWDFQMSCDGGAVVKARTCQKVADGARVKVTIGADKLEGAKACRRPSPPTAKVSNLTLNGKPVR